MLPAGDFPQPPDVSKLAPADRQKAWEQFNLRQREFWQSDAGRVRERAERTYVLVFETNGQFRVDHVPPGKYLLSIMANDPDEEYYRQRMIGSLSHLVRAAALTAILDGTEEITRTLLDGIPVDHAAQSGAHGAA